MNNALNVIILVLFIFALLMLNDLRKAKRQYKEIIEDKTK